MAAHEKQYRVINADAADFGRVGLMVDVLEESDATQRTVWIALDFSDGQEPTAFHKDELEKVGRSE